MQFLIIDCDPRHARTVSRALQSTVGAPELRVAEELESAVAMLEEQSCDAVLLCLWARGCEEAALAAVRRVRRCAPAAALVVVDQRADDRTAAACMQAGAQEYVVKRELAPAALARAVRCAALRQRRQTKLGGALARARARCRSLSKAGRGVSRLDHAAHDIRAPLAYVKDVAGVLAEGLSGDVNDEQRRHLESIAQRIDDVVAVADGLLQRARAAAGGNGLPRGTADVAALLSRVRPLLEHDARQHTVELVVDAGEELPPIRCNAVVVGRALTNVALNAVKFSGGHGAAGRVRVAASQAENGYVEITVADNGPGIAADQQERVFQPFQRAVVHNPAAEAVEKSLEDARRGYGLGLSIARELIEDQGGSLLLESRPGDGTTVRLLLPVATPAGNGSRPERPHFLQRQRSPAACSRTRVPPTPSG